MLQGWFIHFNSGLNISLLLCLRCLFDLILIISPGLLVQTYYKNSSFPNCSQLNLYENRDVPSNFKSFEFKFKIIN